MRPSKGTVTGRVWEIADGLSQARIPAHRAKVIALAIREGINGKTASTQFAAWKRHNYPEFNNVRL